MKFLFVISEYIFVPFLGRPTDPCREMTMKSSLHKSSKSYRRHRDDDSVEQDSPRTKKVKRDGDEEGDYDDNEQMESENPSITFARCLTEEQKFHLKRKMENELADLMGDKTTDGASKVVDNMFKEFLAEKMALIEAEKRKSMATEDLSGDESESSREEGEEDDGEDDDIDAVSNIRDKLHLPIVEPHRMDRPFLVVNW